MTNNQTDYAGFGARLGAFILDSVILLPLDISLALACPLLSAWELAAFFTAKATLRFLYRPVCHKVWGKTMGKRVCRLKVITDSGAPLSWTNVFIRELFFAPAYGFGLVAVWFVMRSAPEITSFADFNNAMRPFYTETVGPLTVLFNIYSIIMPLLQAGFVLKHAQHKALHDLLAGTIVVHHRRVREDGTPEPVACFLCKTIIPPEVNRCPACGWTFRD